MLTRILSKTEKDITRADIALILDYADVAAATSTVAVTSLSVIAGHKVQVALDDTEILYHVGGSAKVYLVDDTVDVFWTASSMAYTSGKLAVYLAVEDMNKWPIA